MASYLDLDNTESLRAKIDGKACDLFKAQPDKPQLQVNRLIEIENGKGKEFRFKKNQEVIGSSEIEALRHESNNLSQVFVIRQDRSWTTLNISRELFENFLGAYGVFSRFWKFAFTFGIKWEENEFEFPGFGSRHISPSKNNLDEAYELAYIFRRAELNHRKPTEGQSPWSIRQTAVYHKFNPNSIPSKSSSTHDSSPLQRPKSTFLLISPSQTLESQLHESFELSVSDGNAIASWNVHRLLVVDSLRGWMDYMAWMELQLREQSSCIVLAKVGAEKKNLSPLTDFDVNFKNRQTLKILEDFVIDLQIILSTMLSTIADIRALCKKCCERHHNKQEEMCGCDQVIEDFDEHVREVKTHVKRAEALRERAKSTTQLLADLLSYEDAVALKDLARESRVESQSMCYLTERSTKDAAAVKVLTVISLIYLPTTIVANFFSTQFVHTNDSGVMRVSAEAWLLAAIALPLTALTIAMWWTWVHCVNISLPNVPPPPDHPEITRENSFRSLLSSRKMRPRNDIEGGMACPPPQPFGSPGGGTWSSTATTLKSG